MSAHALSLLGWGIAIMGAVVMAVGALGVVMGSRSHRGPSETARGREKLAYLVGSALLAVAFALELWAATIRR
jgi:Mn2+/Fe2+ NRAMP family transporter